MNNTASTIISDTGLTAEEITRASRHFAVTRGFLLESVSGLSAAEWDFKPAKDVWSIAENMEHIVLVESLIHRIIGNLSNAPEAELGNNRSEMDEFILNDVPKRSRKVQAGANLHPTRRWSGPEALERFVEGREQSTRLLLTRRLRERAVPHPLFGPWDGYQWLLAAASHGARHTGQIREVKVDPNYPQH